MGSRRRRYRNRWCIIHRLPCCKCYIALFTMGEVLISYTGWTKYNITPMTTECVSNCNTTVTILLILTICTKPLVSHIANFAKHNIVLLIAFLAGVNFHVVCPAIQYFLHNVKIILSFLFLPARTRHKM